MPDLVKVFSGKYFKRRMDGDYVSHMLEYMVEMTEVLQTLENAGSYWKA